MSKERATSSKPGRGRPRQFKQEEVLEKAMRVFWKKGYEQTAITDLVAATGVGAQSLYGSIGNKRTIFIESLTYYLSNIGVLTLARLEQEGPAIDVLTSLFEARCSSGEDSEVCLLTMSSFAFTRETEPDIAAIIDRHAERLIHGIEGVLRRGQREGEVRAGLDPGCTARLLLTLWYGKQSTTRFTGTDAFVEDINASLRAMLKP